MEPVNYTWTWRTSQSADGCNAEGALNESKPKLQIRRRRRENFSLYVKQERTKIVKMNYEDVQKVSNAAAAESRP